MLQGNLFNSVCEKYNSISTSDVLSTVSTSTETTGQTHTKHCPRCLKDKPIKDFYEVPARPDNLDSRCRDCRQLSNDKRMYVNGKYVPLSHPLYKPGRYKSFDDAAFSSLQNYERSNEGQVYIIVNPSWPDWVKIGMAVDAEDRCNGYQTSSPFRDYKVVYAVDTKDRRKSEALAHIAAEKIAERRGEWFKMSIGQAKECIQHGL